MKSKLVIILGPTAVGKTALALEVAERLKGEIINADSQQVYRYMDIGTGKPSLPDRERIPHHLIDIVNPDEEFNAAFFRRAATEAIQTIRARGRSAIVCGGTGLYLKALTQGLFEGPGQDPELRRTLENEIAELGLGTLYRRLMQIDPAVGSTIHPNDRQRIIRAVEVCQLTGRPLSDWQKAHAFRDDQYIVLKIGLNRDRAELYDQINGRSEAMVRIGLLEEVRRLVDLGYGLALRPMQSVGYRQMGEVLQGKTSLAEALAVMKQETRHLAKRQLTWFRRDSEIRWLHPEEQKEEIFRVVSGFLA